MFNITYKTNNYGKPLPVIVRINHHFNTIVLGFAIMCNETVATYKWVIEAFLKSTKGVMSEMVMTNGDKVMRVILAHLMPNVAHRLCT